MATISENLQTIQNGKYGKDVRAAIHEAVSQCYERVSSGSTAGLMLKSVYDTNNNGKVDDSDKLGGIAAGDYLTADAWAAMKPGVRNLLRNSDFSYPATIGWTNCPMIYSISDDGNIKRYVSIGKDGDWKLSQKVNLTAGKTYTASFDVRKNNTVDDNAKVRVKLDALNHSEVMSQAVTWGYFKNGVRQAVSFTPTVTGLETIYFLTLDPNSTQELAIANLKIEEGNTATAWSPSPDDKAEAPTQTGITLAAASWTESSAPYKQTVSCTGVSSDKVILFRTGMGYTADQSTAFENGKIKVFSVTTDQVVFAAYGIKPAIDLRVAVINFGEAMK